MLAWTLRVSREWGVPPSQVMDWSREEFDLAVAFLRLSYEENQRKNPDE